MELKFLTGLGISEDVANQVLAAANKEVEDQKELVSAKVKELETANTSIGELTGKLKVFDGVDVEQLKKDAADWETKYNSDIAALKLDAAIEKSLAGQKVVDAELVASLLDKSVVKLDANGSVTGMSEQLEALKKNKPFLFEQEEKTEESGSNVFVNTGGEHKSGGGGAEIPFQFNTVRPMPAK